MIPKKIHYIWLGGNPKDNLVNICIRSWKEKMPDYEIIEWNEQNLDIEQICRENKYFRECRKRKLWAFMADYLRLKILYENGGIYFDTDVQALKSMDDFLNYECVIGMENEKEVSSAVIACNKNNSLIKKMFDFYNDRIWKEPHYIITHIMSELIEEEKSPINIYPEYTFSPMKYDAPFDESCIHEDTYTIHWFNASWNQKKEVFTFLAIKHIKNPIKRSLMYIRKWLGYYYRKWFK